MSSPRNIHRNLSDLNFDTLLHIVAFLGRRDVESLTRTDKALRGALASILLKGHVVVGWHRQESFRAFMDADPARTSSLRRFGLEVLTDEYTAMHGSMMEGPNDALEESIGAVLKIVGSCLNLVALSLAEIAPFGISPVLLKTTLGYLTQLEDLHLLDITQTYQDVLIGVLPNLRSLLLSFTSDSLCNPKTARETSDPFPFTRGHTSILEKLTLRDASLISDSEPFPHVRVLDLSHVFVPDGIHTLVRLFPGIEELMTRSFYLSSVTGDQLLLLTDPVSIDVQEVVQSARGEYMTLPVHERSWPHLRRVTTRDASELYYLGVLCPNGVVQLVMSNARPRADVMVDVLENLRPKGISCRADFDHLWPAFHRSTSCLFQPFLHWLAASGGSDIVVRWPQELLKFWRIVTLAAILANHLDDASSSVSSLLVQFTAPTMTVYSHRQMENTREAYEEGEQYLRTVVEHFHPLRQVSIDVVGRGVRAWELVDGGWQELSASQAREIWFEKAATAPSFELVAQSMDDRAATF